MAQTPTEQNYYHHPHSHPYLHSHIRYPLPHYLRHPFDLLFNERTRAINCDCIHSLISKNFGKNNDLHDKLVLCRPRRTRTTFTCAQVAELEQYFLQGRYLTSSRLAEISNKLRLGAAQIKIWFKNRRRRHKIQTDRNKDPLVTSTCDDMSQPPTKKVKSSSGPGPPNVQKLDLSRNGISTPTSLTPSPTPSTPTANCIEHYTESLNQYHYNNHHHNNHQQSDMAHHHSTPLLQHLTPAHHQYPTIATQFFQSTVALLQQPNHQNFSKHHQEQHHHHHNNNNNNNNEKQLQQQPQQQQQESLQSKQQTYRNNHQSQYKYQQKTTHSGVLPTAKEDTDFNFNNSSYYLRMSLPTTTSVAATTNAITATPTAAMSTNNEVYEPLTPKNDDCPSLCSGGNSSVADEMDEPNMKSLQMLETKITNGYDDDACGNDNSNINNNKCSDCADGDRGNLSNIIENCTGGVYSKINKISTNGMHETNYQCTMDTFLHAYSAYRKASTNAQFTYCFN